MFLLNFLNIQMTQVQVFSKNQILVNSCFLFFYFPLEQNFYSKEGCLRYWIFLKGIFNVFKQYPDLLKENMFSVDNTGHSFVEL